MPQNLAVDVLAAAVEELDEVEGEGEAGSGRSKAQSMIQRCAKLEKERKRNVLEVGKLALGLALGPKSRRNGSALKTQDQNSKHFKHRRLRLSLVVNSIKQWTLRGKPS